MYCIYKLCVCVHVRVCIFTELHIASSVYLSSWLLPTVQERRGWSSGGHLRQPPENGGSPSPGPQVSGCLLHTWYTCEDLFQVMNGSVYVR